LPQKNHWQPAAVETFSFLLGPAFTKHLSLLKLILVGTICMMQKVGIETKTDEVAALQSEASDFNNESTMDKHKRWPFLSSL
jgi:hypothetical protein